MEMRTILVVCALVLALNNLLWVGITFARSRASAVEWFSFSGVSSNQTADRSTTNALVDAPDFFLDYKTSTVPVPKFNNTGRFRLTRSMKQRLDIRYVSKGLPECATDISILFIVHYQTEPQRGGGSGTMRGHLIHQAIQKNLRFGTSDLRVRSEVRNQVWGNDLKKKFTFCIFVKVITVIGASACRAAGSLVVFDLLDASLDIVTRNRQYLDAVICGSPFQAEYLRSHNLISRTLLILNIPHLHTNDVTNPVRHVDFGIATPTLMMSLSAGVEKVPDPLAIRALTDYLQTVNVELKVVHPEDLLNRSRTGALVDRYGRSSQVVHHELTRLADLAVIWHSAGQDDFKTHPHHVFRPVTRLAYWMSHAVPTVCSASPPYVELLDILGLKEYLVAENVSQLVNLTSALMTNQELRMGISQMFFQAGQFFSTQQQPKLYSRTLCAALEHLRGDNKIASSKLII